MNGPIGADLVARLRAALGAPGLDLDGPLEQLHGGFGTVTFAFRLSGAPPAFSVPLVLRLFKAISPPQRVTREACVQQWAIDCGLPVPRPLLFSSKPAIAERGFLVMERATGATMLEGLWRAPWEAVALGSRLARIQARIHDAPPELLVARAREAGIRLRSLHTLMGALAEKVENLGDPGFRRGLDWLREDAVVRQGEARVCHGDFHPANVLAERGRVTAVLDWTSVAIAEREWDIAQTLLLLRHAPLRRGFALRLLRRLIALAYLRASRALAPLDEGRLHYYAMLHAFHARLLAAEMKLHRASGRIDPHEPGTAWEWPAGVAVLRRQFAEGTGIRLS